MKDEPKQPAPPPEQKTLADMSIQELKAIAFDQTLMRDQAINNLTLIMQELQKRPPQP